MISNHKIQTALDEIKDISRIDLALYTEKGKPVAATFEPEGDLEGAITSFADSMAESQMLSGYHFFKVIADGEIEYILLTKSQAEDAYMVGRLAVCQIRNLADETAKILFAGKDNTDTAQGYTVLDPEGNPTTEITMKDILEFNFIWMEPTEEALAASLTHFDGDVDDYGADETMGESYVHDGKVYVIFYVSHAMGDYTVVRID